MLHDSGEGRVAPAAPSSFLTLLLVRHGETTYNAQDRYQGQRDVPLSEVGQAQAARLGRRLAAAYQQEVAGSATLSPRQLPGPPVAVYASDLGRARETAEIVVREALDGGGALPVTTLPALRERSFGVWEGRTGAEIRVRFARGEDAPGGETWAEVWERMSNALATIWLAHAVQSMSEATSPTTVLVVGHGGSLRAWVCRALGVGEEFVRRFRLDNASLSIVELWDAGNGDALALEGRVALLNDTSHLAPPPA